MSRYEKVDYQELESLANDGDKVVAGAGNPIMKTLSYIFCATVLSNYICWESPVAEPKPVEMKPIKP